jgi:hypothetical protein
MCHWISWDIAKPADATMIMINSIGITRRMIIDFIFSSPIPDPEHRIPETLSNRLGHTKRLSAVGLNIPRVVNYTGLYDQGCIIVRNAEEKVFDDFC